MTDEVLTAHLSGDVHIGLYPLLDGDRCWWLAADFDGPAAMLDALSYLKAARSAGVPAALEVSRSGIGAHAWMFFTAPIPAATARRLGTGLLREAIALRGRMDLSSYDRLFPSQDVLPASGASATSSQPPCRADADVTEPRSSSISAPWSHTRTSGPICPHWIGSRPGRPLGLRDGSAR
ncbi:MAG: hypothetical protein M3R63_06970 [Actinomycetota bacterium]|nr:hypothetical protein [Actinomycetota bacterium]